MTKTQDIKLFEDSKIRTVWDSEKEKWYFAIVDVVSVLTGSSNPSDYLKKMKKREPSLAEGWGQIVTPLSVETAGGKQRVNCADAEGMFRIIQSIPSPKAEPIKQWMAHVASQRVDQMQDPELSINQAMDDYRKLGYPEKWIKSRLKSIEIRNDLTDEWKRSGVKEGSEFAILTNILTKEWSGKDVKSYKAYKCLKKENLRDNMTNIELVLNSLAEAATTELSKQENPKGLSQSSKVAKKGGGVAKVARQQLENQLGRSVISSQNAKDIRTLESPEDQKQIED